MSNKESQDVIGEARSGSDADRVFLLECRLEQVRANLDEARAEAHRARALLAEAAAREAGHARHHQVLHEELAAARKEVESLHRRLEHSEALRAGLQGRLFESATPEDAQELVSLRVEVAAARDLTVARQRTVMDLRARVEDLVASRETLLTRVAEWQCAARKGDAEAIDMAEFIAALRHDILELEHRCVMAERREADLREQLRQAGTQGNADSSSPYVSAAETNPQPSDSPRAADEPEIGFDETLPLSAGDDADLQPSDSPRAADEPEAEAEEAAPLSAGDDAEPQSSESSRAADEPGAEADEVAPLAAGDDAESRINALLRLGRSGEAEAFYAIRSWLVTPDPRVRAAAYQALGHLLEHDPSRLEPHVRWGMADADPRVRRRVVLAAASARGLDLRLLLDPLRRDPDPQVRRVVNEVLRRAPSSSDDAAGSDAPASDDIRAGVAS